MRAYALIPARSGSRGLPDKNILPIDGHPLLAWSVAFARRLPVERVLLSTDRLLYAEIGRSYGAEVPVLRGAAASSDTAMEEDILADLEATLPGAGIPLPDLWVWLKPTCPFRDRDAVVQALELLAARPDLDSVRLVSEADARLHRINAEGFLEPLLAEWDPGRSKMRRSEFPKVYQPFNLEIFRHQGWRERGALFMGRRIHPIVLPRITGLDVDDADGFAIIRALIEAKPRPEIVERHLSIPTRTATPATDPATPAEVLARLGAVPAESQVDWVAEVMRRAAAEGQPPIPALLSLIRWKPALLRRACQKLAKEGDPATRFHALGTLARLLAARQDLVALRATLRDAIATAPDNPDPRLELLRLELVAPSGDDADWELGQAALTPLGALSYALQRRVALGQPLAPEAFEAELDRRLALLDPAAFPPALARIAAAEKVALVGNGPSLLGRGAGAEIDAHDCVVRVNYPMLADFAADAGRRTDAMLFHESKRPILPSLMARDPGHPAVPALGLSPTVRPGAPPATPPRIAHELVSLVREIGYNRATSGFMGIVLIGAVLRRALSLYGFTFFRPGEPGHYFGEATGSWVHEFGYERWFTGRVLPLLRPGLRGHPED